ncbi:hypothetical protein TPHA_0J02620 [Tetrapisispora phaffii CBS 4417]|uniref:ubiquitinyl hydrolase 1 n=1 Tax=Tetrapisispora phaffii (strain ATCC 24235 / CBS 4417 / NBRC 1672 / NRRL Y-8282 / UCD 70-5) TaxID=1071381 RepID=G8BYZ0_TETPH|nr:hypothetical protein TPHA_0J02620 [Tetrapisispora phaffii CBS 4417]CCE65082.1 hypothetical protein TPHA_0J02620 [Tetrapisispora phaffii CBS 4417]
MHSEKGIKTNSNNTHKIHSKDSLYILAKKFKKLGEESKLKKHHHDADKINPNTANSSAQNVEKNDTSIDDGMHLLYQNIEKEGVFKTSQRILDDILTDIAFMSLDSEKSDDIDFKDGVLNLPTIKYSLWRKYIKPFKIILFNTNNPVVDVKLQHKSVTSPKNNTITELYGLLVPKIPRRSELNTFDEYIRSKPLYSIRITVKTRHRLEHKKKHIALTPYFLLDDFDKLHEVDKSDFPKFNKDSKDLLDFSIYISSDTNKIILIEIFKPAFNQTELDYLLSSASVLNRSNELDNLHEELQPDYNDAIVEEQIDTIEILLHCIMQNLKGSPERELEKQKTSFLLSDDVKLGTYVDIKWLEENFDIKVKEQKRKDHVSITLDEALKLSFDDPNPKNQAKFDKITRYAMELMYLGKVLQSFYSNEEEIEEYMEDTIFKQVKVHHTTSFWTQILNEYQSIFSSQKTSTRCVDEHFINLCIDSNVSEKDIITNYEIQLRTDPDNDSKYFESLKYVSRKFPDYIVLEKYCKENVIISKAAYLHALEIFKYSEEYFNAIEHVSEIWDKYTELVQSNNNNDDQYRVDLVDSFYSLATVKKSSPLIYITKYEPFFHPVTAYLKLNVDAKLDSENIVLAYTMQIREVPEHKIQFDRALFAIAIQRHDLSLLYVLKQNCSAFNECISNIILTSDDAFEIIGMPKTSSELSIINTFTKYWKETDDSNPVNFILASAALREVSKHRASALLRHFYEFGKVNPKMIDSELWPTGINNIGNTCYLNSLLQYYFSITLFREFIENYQSIESDLLNSNAEMSKRRVGGREIQNNEINRSVQFIYQVQDLFKLMVHTKSRKVTPSNQLAYLAFAPNNAEIKFKHKSELESSEEHQLTTSHSIALSSATSISHSDIDTQDHDISLNSTSYSNRLVAMVTRDDLETTLEIGNQQDVTECINTVLYQVETGSMPLYLDADNEQMDLVKELFYGETIQEICPIKKFIKGHEKRELYSSLLVNILDSPTDLYEVLDEYFADEYMSMEEYGEVKKTLSITKLPTILNIQIQRVYYDKEKLVPYKCGTALPFKNEIFLDRYIKGNKKENDVLEKARLELKLAKVKYRELVSEYNSVNKSISDRIITTYDRIEELNAVIEEEVTKDAKIRYSLFAVFIHRGQASFGHYWVYIRDFENGIWRKYNDHQVTGAHEDEIFKCVDGDISTPYFLAYVDSSKKSIVKPLVRDVTRAK